MLRGVSRDQSRHRHTCPSDIGIGVTEGEEAREGEPLM